MLFDNYDSKNNVILEDLKKKAESQEHELKKTIEQRDKLMALYQDTKEDVEEYKDDEKSYKIVNILLFILLLAKIIFIIYKLYTYPIDGTNKSISIKSWMY